MLNKEITRSRIVLADALRGFALMGLFLIHMVEYFELYWYNPSPGWIHNFMFGWFGGKAYAIFALLFGFSYYIILDNYSNRGVDFRWRFVWRCILLLIMGYIHSLFYGGDILQLLAICGILLVITHRLNIVWISMIGFFFLLQIPSFLQTLIHVLHPNEAYTQPLFYELSGNSFKVYAHGSISELIRHNMFAGQIGKWIFFTESGRLWNIIGFMFFGVVLGRIRFFEKKIDFKRLATCLVIIVSFLSIIEFTRTNFLQDLGEGMATWSLNQAFSLLENMGCVGFIIIAFTIFFNIKPSQKLLVLFAPAGRITLSLYVLQSLIFVPCYYGFGLGFYENFGQLNSLILGIIVWIAQVVFAAFIVKKYRYGPLEKLWRIGTLYGLKSD